MIDAGPVLSAVSLQPYSYCSVLAGRNNAVLLGDEERGAHHVLVPLHLAEQHGPAALRPRVNLRRHVGAAPLRAAGPAGKRAACLGLAA